MNVYGMPGHVIRRLHQISTHVFTHQMQAAGFDLTPVQFAAMDAIMDRPGIDQTGVAEAIGYDRATIGGVIDRLEQKGLVVRKTSAADRRVREVSPTGAGQKLYRSALPIVSALQNDILPGLNRTEREQFFALARKAIEMIRERGVASLNTDILFGLPHQTRARITETVQKLLSFAPDRVALYGYAHVPWMAKRQQMIPSDMLPTPQERLDLFETARRLFVWDGYAEIGIDHFAVPGDGLAIAQKTGKLRRNFQGYTDDTSEVLIGLGASSISRFPQGYAQNAPSTSAYAGAIRDGRFATSRGHTFKGEDKLRGRLIEALMCDFRIDANEIVAGYGVSREWLFRTFRDTAAAFDNLLEVTEDGLYLPEKTRPLTRMVARTFDAYDLSKAGHSSAI